MASKKLIFFEEIDIVFCSLAEKYLNDGCKVYFFKINPSYKKKAWIQKYLETGKLIDISKMVFDYVLSREAAFYAFENIDAVFASCLSKSYSIKNMGKLLKISDFDVENVYKQKIIIDLENDYLTELKINEIVKNERPDEVYFFPQYNVGKHIVGSSILMDNVKILKNNSIVWKLKKILERSKQIFLLGAPLYVFFNKFGGISINKNRKKYKVGLKEDNPKHINSMNYHGNNVFLDDEELPVNDVLFIVGWKKDKIIIETTKKFNCASLYNGREVISLVLLLDKFVNNLLINWLRAVFFSLFEEFTITRVNRSIFFDYVAFNILLDTYEITNYIKRLEPEDASATHILSKYGVTTWFVFLDNTSNDYHLNWDPNKRNRTFWSFMYFDNVVIHGSAVERDFKKHRNQTKRYIQAGVFFSQTAMEVKIGKLKSPIFDIIKSKSLPKKIIGVFDTAYLDNTPLTIKDGVQFGIDILRLLEDLPEIGIIFKTAKEPNVTPELTPIYNKLNEHERCLLFYHRCSKDGISAPEVIAASDLTISAAYTSTVAEALGARKKAMYYETREHFIGNKYYFNNFPNLVAHDYNELKRLVNYWLYEVTNEQFDNFLNKHIKNEIDPYLDAKAFSRLRKLLTANDDIYNKKDLL